MKLEKGKTGRGTHVKGWESVTSSNKANVAFVKERSSSPPMPSALRLDAANSTPSGDLPAIFEIRICVKAGDMLVNITM